MSAERLHLLIGLPRLDSSSDVEDLPAGVAAACASVRTVYGDREAPRVRMLPHDVDRHAVTAAARTAGALGSAKVAIGVSESELAPVVLDFNVQPHLVAFGDAECGKTGLLRNIAAGLTETSSPQECQFVVVDFRRTLLGAVDNDYLRAYATAAQSCAEAMAELAATLKERLPPSDVTQQQLRDRSWWQGPDIYVLIDDYDLIPGGTMNHPLGPLVEYLPQARDVGLRVLIVRRIGGAGRALMDPIIGRLKDLSCHGLVMSGTKEEGALFGFKAQPMPPGRGMLMSRSVNSDVIQLSRMPDL